MTETLELVTGAITAMGALGLAAFALVDALKAWPGGGMSNVGFRHILEGCQPFAAALANGAGRKDAAPRTATWEELLRAQWRNGRDKDAQKTLVRSLVRLGLTQGESESIAAFCGIREPAAFDTLIAKLQRGEEPTPAEGGLLGRVDAIIGYQIDAAFERAEQRYRNVARVSAGLIAILLGIAGAFLLDIGQHAADSPLRPWVETLFYGLAAGLLAVPIAPIAKDLTSSLSAAVTAVKAVRRR